tara:strand:- start:1542 stop:2081 length:540 start_codon:yes stop_codon:yes gene_type:complete
MTYKKTKYYQLRKEWKELNKEYDSIKLLFDQIGIEFSHGVSKFCTENDLGDPFSKTEVEPQNVRGNELTSSSKKLFRKIMLNTHPDKVGNEEKNTKIYTKATKANKSGNLQELLDAGKEASITPDLNEITLEELDILEFNIKELKGKIEKIQNSYAWAWFHANPNRRNEIFYHFIDSLS